MRKKSLARQVAIVEAATQEFYECGFVAASIAGIAARTGLSKPTIYRYFPSKESLFAQVKFEAIENFLAPAIMTFLNENDIVKALKEFSPHYLALRQTDEFISLMRMVYGESGRTEIGSLMWHNGKYRLLKQFCTKLAVAMEEGRLRQADPMVATFHFFGLMDAELVEPVVLRVRPPASQEELQEIASRALSVFLNAYQNP